jgi:hypothetical protein
MKLGEGTEVTVDLKTLAIILTFVVTVVGMWGALKADINEAKRLPEPEIGRTEYDLKDKLIRETIMNTQQQVEANGKKLDIIESRLYELSIEQNR